MFVWTVSDIFLGFGLAALLIPWMLLGLLCAFQAIGRKMKKAKR
jgi:hypothetical protein